MADTYGLKNLIGNSSDQFKSDFINKINQALKKLDGVGYSSPASATGEPVGMSVASPKKTGTTAATAPDVSDVAYAMEAPKAKKKKEEKIEKILGDKSIYTKAVNNKKVEDEMQKAIEKNNQRALDYKDTVKVVPSTIAKDAIRDAKTQKYADEQIGKQYDKDMEKWLQYVVSTEDADQDLADYANWIQGVLNGTGFSKYKKEKLRDGLQGLINTLIYEDEDKTTVDAAKGVSDYVAGGTHASAPEQESNKKNRINEGMSNLLQTQYPKDYLEITSLGEDAQSIKDGVDKYVAEQWHDGDTAHNIGVSGMGALYYLAGMLGLFITKPFEASAKGYVNLYTLIKNKIGEIKNKKAQKQYNTILEQINQNVVSEANSNQDNDLYI